MDRSSSSEHRDTTQLRGRRARDAQERSRESDKAVKLLIALQVSFPLFAVRSFSLSLLLLLFASLASLSRASLCRSGCGIWLTFLLANVLVVLLEQRRLLGHRLRISGLLLLLCQPLRRLLPRLQMTMVPSGRRSLARRSDATNNDVVAAAAAITMVVVVAAAAVVIDVVIHELHDVRMMLTLMARVVREVVAHHGALAAPLRYRRPPLPPLRVVVVVVR